MTLEQLQSIEDSKDKVSIKDIKPLDNILLNAPDWQSLDAQDWIFYKAICINDIDRTNNSIKRTSYSTSNLNTSKNIAIR